MNEKSWVHKLFFDAYFEDALTRYRAATGLGCTYALFNLLNEKLYELGFMDEKGYHYHREKYGRPLVDEFERKLESQNRKTSLEILKKEEELRELTEQLSMAFDQWDDMKPKARDWYVEKAKTHKELAISQDILKRAQVEAQS